MTKEKIISIIDLYDSKLTCEPVQHEDAGGLRYTDRMQHLKWMFIRIREFVSNDQTGKAFRWLGFIQGVLFCLGLYTLKELRDHSRSDDA